MLYDSDSELDLQEDQIFFLHQLAFRNEDEFLQKFSTNSTFTTQHLKKLAQVIKSRLQKDLSEFIQKDEYFLNEARKEIEELVL